MKKKNKIEWSSIYAPISIIYLILGVVFVVLALKGFMVPNHFLDGGITGISILAHEFTHYNISIFLVGLNLPFLIMGYYKLGSTFLIKGLFAISLLAIFMHFLEIPVVTEDKILIAVFGGFLIGLGIGLVIKGGGIVDGLEIIADYTNKKSGFSSGEIILVVNSIIFLLLAFGFGIEPAMYSILTYYTAVKTSDYVVDGFEQYTALTIISKNDAEVKSIIVNDFKKAISVYKGERGYLPESFQVKHDCDIVVTIVTRLEIHRIKKAILKMDPTAFFYLHSIREVKGGVIKKLRPH